MNRICVSISILLFWFCFLSKVYCQDKSLSEQTQVSRTINADFLKVKSEKCKAYANCIGAGRAYEGLRADWQNQLRIIQKEFSFKFIRFHGIFHDDMGVCTRGKDGKLILNFQNIDRLYDFLLSVGIKPFVELGFMPNALKNSDKTVFWWKANISRPKNYDEWAYLVSEFTKHVTTRYGRKEIRSWYFEVWNEPDHPGFFDSTQAEYFSLYQVSANAIKSVDSFYRVGGPATSKYNPNPTGGPETSGNKWVSELINFCFNNRVPLDFISTHCYGVNGAFDELGVKQLRLHPDSLTINRDIERVWSEINISKMPHLELHYTEWNTSYSPRDLVHDTYLNATYVLNVLRNINPNTSSISYWTFTDIFEEAGPPMRPLHGGFGLLTVDDLPKPTYFSYKYLYQLGNLELNNSDSKSWVCKDAIGNIQVLMYDISMPKYKTKDFNNTIFRKEVKSLPKGTVKVNLTNIPNGLYRLEYYITGHRKNDLFTAYSDIGCPDQLSRDQILQLKSKTADFPVIKEKVRVINGNFYKNIPFRENDIVLLKLSKISK